MNAVSDILFQLFFSYFVLGTFFFNLVYLFQDLYSIFYIFIDIILNKNEIHVHNT